MYMFCMTVIYEEKSLKTTGLENMAVVVTQQCCVLPVLTEQGWSDVSPLVCLSNMPCHWWWCYAQMWDCHPQKNEILTNFPSCLVQHCCEWMGNHMWCTLWCHQILSKDGMAACIWYLHCCGDIIDSLMKNFVYSALHSADHLCCMYFFQKITLYVILQQLRTLLEQILPLQLSASAEAVVTIHLM